MITGHSVFSQRENSGGGNVLREALDTGKAVISIQALDDKAESYSIGPHSEWVDDYLRLKARRGPGGLLLRGD